MINDKEIYIQFGERLNKLRVTKNISQNQIANYLNIAQTTYSGYENGSRKIPLELLQKISSYFDVSPNYLILGNEPNLNIDKSNILQTEQPYIKKYKLLDKHGKKIVDIVLDEEYKRVQAQKISNIEQIENCALNNIEVMQFELSASAGTGVLLDSEDYNLVEYPAFQIPRGTSFAIVVNGDSMMPEYENGQTVFVKRQNTLDDGQIGIFVLNGEGYIKKIEGQNESNCRLVSLNKKYKDILISEHDDLRCVGLVLN